ncbi:redoxin domain-containing protein [Granulicella mallensis]|uniref:Alkyl hydroperoxide reductase/ Thiol specific antioxidant/ Mal allergen n=1 Tax=Granulicella mallensis (strain ATCC BAA-1857 / DSM 23137 / MP5ACTX8) TaxID=682795 RepID=G8NW54_GRAMM|nr:redoxin domain-containing protein [Granulicella mallensis]AEU36566.1 alkyl hydroperoxide reductase/ Thiol specific antioxidant/ Mal allergen [Granulicella mallensis MP5ACTX8]
MRKLFTFALTSLMSLALHGQASHPILALGSPAPNFALPGVDGKIHKLSDYASSPVLVVVFTCNHCPIAQMYERRIEQLYEEGSKRGVAVVAIQGNDPKATTTEELDSSDIGDTLDEMKTRVQYKHLHYPYLYDGATQSVTRAYGPQATPHVFIFDKERHLRYEGRMDNSYRIEMVKTQDARYAIEALLANKPVPVTHTGVFGCSTKWQDKEPLRTAYEQKLEAQPVTVEPIDAQGLKKLRANAGDNYTLVSFWATWCGSCVAEFSDLQDTFRMYTDRGFKLVTVSANMPDEKPGVLRLLQQKHATSRNLLFASDDTAALQAAFDPKWQSAVPYTVLLGPNGKVLYSSLGSVDMLELRRKILAAMPSDYSGFNEYWKNP